MIAQNDLTGKRNKHSDKKLITEKELNRVFLPKIPR